MTPDRLVSLRDALNGVSASAAVLAGALCLSISAILVKLAGVDAATTAVLRCAIAVLVLVPLALHERKRRGSLSRTGVGWAVAAGVALGADYAAWTASIYHVGAGVSTVLVNVQVVVLPALAFLIDREKITNRFLIALPLMLIGISFVGGLWTTGTRGSQAITGTVLGVVAGIGYAVYLFLTRRAYRFDPGRLLQPLAWATSSAALTAAALAPLSEGIDVTQISARSWVLLVALAVIGQVAAWLLIQHGSVRLPAPKTASLLLTQPVLALALSAVILHEYPALLQLLGAVLIVASVTTASGVIRTTRARAHDARDVRARS